jgi:hypothetical protein
MYPYTPADSRRLELSSLHSPPQRYVRKPAESLGSGIINPLGLDMFMVGEQMRLLFRCLLESSCSR